MVRKVQSDNKAVEAAGKPVGRKRVPPKRATPRPGRTVPEAAPADDPPPTASGAKALIQAGLKALGDVRGDRVARQARVCELLLGIGQSPAWTGSAAGRTRSVVDPFGKFEDVFDQRVARSLERLGMPSPQALQALTEQVKLLTELLGESDSAKRRKR
jgi:hypothetical protein